MLRRADRIEKTLSEALALLHLEVLDESGNHSGPEDAQSHFKVIAVSAQFQDQSRINRHRMVNGLLQSEFDGGMHALAIHAYTQSEWQDRFGQAPLSPPCAGAEKAGADNAGGSGS